jgi:hypothetical protein
MLVEDCVLFQMAKCCRAAPPYRSVTLYSQACACERSRKASPPEGHDRCRVLLSSHLALFEMPARE